MSLEVVTNRHLPLDRQGNLEDLHSVDLGGHSVAAIEDCSQRFQVYFHFDQLNEIQKRPGPNRAPWLPDLPFHRRACVSTGVYL